MREAVAALVAVFTAIISVALLAVLVAPNARTGTVIRETFQGFGSALQVATGPVTGAGIGPVGIGMT